MSDDDAVGTGFESADYIERIRAINRVEETTFTSLEIQQLVKLVTDDGNQQVRYAAISRLSNLDSTRLSADDSRNVLHAARYALANDKEPSCKAGAADLIAGLQLTDGFDDLIDTFAATDDWMLKFSIAAGLGEMGDPRAFDFLKGVLETDVDEQEFLLITAAIGSLGELGDDRALPVIEKFLKHEDSSIQERAQIAYDVLSGKASSS